LFRTPSEQFAATHFLFAPHTPDVYELQSAPTRQPWPTAHVLPWPSQYVPPQSVAVSVAPWVPSEQLVVQYPEPLQTLPPLSLHGM
jgi:hypothetical protein